MGGGAPISIFESGPIMMYLAEKTGRFWPQDPRNKYEVAQRVGWQLANQGPKLGEQGHFRRAAESGNNGDLSYALRRFDNEAHRIYGVMNLGLFDKRYLAAGAYTISDMICYLWAPSGATRKIEIDEFPNVKRWLGRNRRAAGRQESNGDGAGVPGGSGVDQRRGAGPSQKTRGGAAGAADSRRMDSSCVGVFAGSRNADKARIPLGRQSPAAGLL
jgi:glutathione S-transferase